MYASVQLLTTSKQVRYSVPYHQCRFYLGLFQSPGRQKRARQAKHSDLGYAASQHVLLQANYSSTVETQSIPKLTSLIYKLQLL